MGTPWPAPLAEEQADNVIDDRGRPNYALRRAIVALAVLAVVGVGVAWYIGRRGGDDTDAGASLDGWNTVVLLDERSGDVTLSSADGTTDESFEPVETELEGLLDIGLADRVVVGVAGDLATDGLGILDLDDGRMTEITVDGEAVGRLDTSAHLLVSAGPRDPLSLVDVRAGEVVELSAFVDARDPIVNPSQVRIDPEHSHVAFTELSELETVLVDLDERTSVALAGSVIDIASGAVLTITNRGETTLVDLYAFDGERIGTVETQAAAGGLLLDDRSALVVTRAGALVRVDFDDESVDELGDIADELDRAGELPDDTSAPSDSAADAGGSSAGADGAEGELVNAVTPVLDRTRLVVLGAAGMVILDVEGEVVATDRVLGATVPSSLTTADRCVLIGSPGSEQTLWDTAEGTRIETFDPGVATGRSADGCTIAYVEDQVAGTDPDAQPRARLVGRGIAQAVDGEIGAVARDGSAAVGRDRDGTFIIDAATGDRVDVQVDTVSAVFTDR